jgi:NADH:ubiquinone oxidoreductase subunit 2 (subunit N)
VGVVISIYYYFGVIRAIYWGQSSNDAQPIQISFPMRFAVFVCIAGMFWLGLFPSCLLRLAQDGAAALGF